MVLNSVKAAVEMLNKKSNKYSDRPFFPMAGGLVELKYGLSLLPYGDRFHEVRRQFRRSIGNHALLKAHHDVEQFAIHMFLKRVYEHPEQLAVHIRR